MINLNKFSGEAIIYKSWIHKILADVDRVKERDYSITGRDIFGYSYIDNFEDWDLILLFSR